MKLVIVTVVEEYKKNVIQLFRKAQITNFSESDIAGFKDTPSSPLSSNWFAGHRGGADSELFFAFTELDKARQLFHHIKDFNREIKSSNPIRAVIIPIEDHI